MFSAIVWCFAAASGAAVASILLFALGLTLMFFRHRLPRDEQSDPGEPTNSFPSPVHSKKHVHAFLALWRITLYREGRGRGEIKTKGKATAVANVKTQVSMT